MGTLSNDDDENEHLEGDDGIMEFDALMNMEQSDLHMGVTIGCSDTINSLTPMEKGSCIIGHYNARNHK
jgi:hypothetical protein